MLVDPYIFGSGGGGGGGSDPDFSDVGLLLHFDGSPGSSTFTDSSSFGNTMTGHNGPVIQNSTVKFGSGGFAGIGSSNNSGAYLTTPVSPGGPLDMGTGPFTIEGWFYFTGAQTFNNLVSQGVFAVDPTVFRIIAQVATPLTCYSSQVGCTAGIPSSNAWHHFALVGDGIDVTLYLDGVGGTPVAQAGAVSGTVLYIGTDSTGNGINGALDDIRITKGVARYTSNFSPPTAPFPDM